MDSFLPHYIGCAKLVELMFLHTFLFNLLTFKQINALLVLIVTLNRFKI